MLNFFGYFLSGYLPLPLFREDLPGYIDAMSNTYQIDKYRVRSIFGEPAHYCQYVLLGLVISLFYNNSNFKINAISIFLTIGIFLSVSNTGILVSALIWVLFLFEKIKYNPVNLIRCFIFTAGSGIVIFFLMQTPFYQIFQKRLDYSTEGRFSAYSYLLDILTYSPDRVLLGSGMDSSLTDYYMSGYVKMVCYFGIIGFILYSVINFYLFIKVDRLGKVALFIFFILNGAATEMTFGPFLFLYTAFTISIIKKKNISYNSVIYE
jgi:hypothetical protein